MGRWDIFKLIATVGGVALLILYISRLNSYCTSDGECAPVRNAKGRVVEVLVSKYNVPEEKARRIAEDLLSGSKARANVAAEEIDRLGAVMDVIKAIGQ